MDLGSNNKSLKNLSFLEFINVFSILVVLGSVSTAFFFVRYFKADIPLSFYWVLGSGVWIIYTADHVYDGIKLGQNTIFLRHAIHYTYRQVLVPTILALAAFDLILVYTFFTKYMITVGVAMGSLVLIYFAMVHLLKSIPLFWLKEVFIAVMVAAGMVIYPGFVGDLNFNLSDMLVIGIFVLMNFTNLIMFDYFDYSGDKDSKMESIAIGLGKKKTKQIVYQLLASIFVLLTTYTFLVRDISKVHLSISVLLMLNILLLIIINEEKFEKNALYRFWGDFIYLIPGLVYLVI